MVAWIAWLYVHVYPVIKSRGRHFFNQNRIGFSLLNLRLFRKKIQADVFPQKDDV